MKLPWLIAMIVFLVGLAVGAWIYFGPAPTDVNGDRDNNTNSPVNATNTNAPAFDTNDYLDQALQELEAVDAE